MILILYLARPLFPAETAAFAAAANMREVQ